MVPVPRTELRLSIVPVASREVPEAAALRGAVALMEALGLALVVYDSGGRIVSETAGASGLLRGDPEEDRLRAAARRLAIAVGNGHRRNGGRGRAATELVTALARYELHAAASPAALFGRCADVIVAFAAQVPPPISDDGLRRRFALTSRETEVARLMTRGLTNAAIARSLVISHHTAERHAERVLRKLRVSTRTAAAALLLTSGS